MDVKDVGEEATNRVACCCYWVINGVVVVVACACQVRRSDEVYEARNCELCRGCEEVVRS